MTGSTHHPPRPMVRALISGGLLILIALAMVGCQNQPALPPTPTSPPPPADPARAAEPSPTGVEAPPAPTAVAVSIDLGRAPGSIDPGLIAPLDATANDLAANLFIGLTRLNPATQRIEPVFAREWQQLEDGVTWYVFLRDDVFWVRVDPETGAAERVRPVTAADVVFAVRRACSASTGAPLGSYPGLFLIRGCRDLYLRGAEPPTQELLEQTLGARVLNDVAVEIKLTDNLAILPTLMAMSMLHPVPAELVENEGEAWTRPDVIWTSGAYAVQPDGSWEEGVTLVASEHWPLERPGNVGIVQVGFEGSAETYRAWQNGDLALAALSSSQLPGSIPDDPAFRLLAQPATMSIAVSYETPPLQKPGVRQALSLGLDREAVIREVLNASGEFALPAASLIPPGTTAGTSDGAGAAGFDPEAARAALAGAGHENCDWMLPVTLLVDDSSPVSVLLAARIVQSWEEVLGCQGIFTVEERPLFDVLNRLQNRSVPRQPLRPALIGLGWQGDYPDARHWLADLTGCRELFPDSYLDQARPCTDADEDLLRAISQPDPDIRAALYDRIVEEMFGPQGEMPLIPVFHPARLVAVSPWLAIPPAPAGPLRFDEWVADPEGRP